MSKMTEKDWQTLGTEFPGLYVGAPSVCTAYWDLPAYRAYYQAVKAARQPTGQVTQNPSHNGVQP